MSITAPVRVRFAPSPTGYLHVGSVRSALFNYLWARHNDGVFVLRIEDTDQSRLVEGAEAQITASLVALGITPDEGVNQGGKYGPYRQSDRLDIYQEHAATLLESGALYPCWCSPERLSALREAAQSKGIAFKYDRHCLMPENQQSFDEPHVLRFRIPDDHVRFVSWTDAVRGAMKFATIDLDDFVAIKSDRYPTYQFANVVDDHLMAISHVLRADEWLPSTPKHLLVFDAFNWDRPIYAHLPPVQASDGRKKLSKRDGAQSVEEYITDGYLPEALMSFLASLGWNDGTTQEVYWPQDLIKQFTLERIQKSPAQFDRERLTWINGYMIRHLELEELNKKCQSFWPKTATDFDAQYCTSVLALVQERLKYLGELSELTEFFFSEPTALQLRESLVSKKVNTTTISEWLNKTQAAFTQKFTSDETFTTSNVEQVCREELAKKLFNLDQPGPYFMALRAAITGRTVSPGLFETMNVLGRKQVIKRLSQAIASLGVED